jgi:glutaminyl-tRNA synthetase
MCVIEPLLVLLNGYPDGQVEHLDAPSFPADVGGEGSRTLPLSQRLYIEREDFSLAPPPKWHRLCPGGMVRLRYAGVIRCDEVIQDGTGRVTGLVCRYLKDGDPELTGANVKGAIHWVSAAHALDVELRLYDRLFNVEVPESLEQLNPSSLSIATGCKIEPSVATSSPGSRFQFERQGYYTVDPDSTANKLVFNRTVTLRDSWSKEEAKPAPRLGRAGAAATPTAKAPAIDDLEGVAHERARRYRDDHDVSEAVAIVLAQDTTLGDLFDAAGAAGARGKAASIAANLVANELRALVLARDKPLAFAGVELAELALMIADGAITSAVAKDVLARLATRGGSPRAIVTELGAATLADSELGPVIDEVLAAHPDEVARYKGGKTSLLAFFVGQAMRKTRGKANAQATQKLFEARLR